MPRSGEEPHHDPRCEARRDGVLSLVYHARNSRIMPIKSRLGLRYTIFIDIKSQNQYQDRIVQYFAGGRDAVASP